MTFIGVEADADDANADRELISYLKREVALRPEVATQSQLTISQQTYGYELVVEKLAGWSQGDGAFLARTTPYVYVAAEMLGADLDVLATYRSKATNATTYRSYFVVNRSDFPRGATDPRRTGVVSQAEAAQLHLPQQVQHLELLRVLAVLPPAPPLPHGPVHRRAVGHRRRRDPHRRQSELVKRVARNEANLAAVWDGTRVKFAPGNRRFRTATPSSPTRSTSSPSTPRCPTTSWSARPGCRRRSRRRSTGRSAR